MMTTRISNKLRDSIIARIHKLMASYAESKLVEHSGTKGSLREQYLIDFFRDVLPAKYSVGSGFICDVIGHISLQLDFIIADTSLIPAMNLDGGQAFVPVESAVMAFEVKSKLRSSHLDQLQKQEKSLLSLQPLNVVDAVKHQDPPAFTPVLQFVVAFDTDVSIATLSRWVEKIPTLYNLCS